MKKQTPAPRTRTFRVVAWANIITQLLFPVAASLTPVWVSAAPKSQTEINYTQPYKLKAGETVASVAKQYHLTVNQLKKINQFRTFSKPFTALGAGDEIDVPWDNAAVRSTGDEAAAAAAAGTASEAFWADTSSQVANAVKSGDPSAVALDKARGLATDAATQEIQNWLKGYGTARVKLGVDNKGTLEGSELDLLLPLYDTQSQLTYTQMGLRRVDKRTTANIGVGQRLFLTDQMLGYNTFLDHDISGNHTRMGIGAEYWRDYLKLGANGYFRLSGWRNADNLDGYDARPANGFDLRTEAYLPAYPQLGGKLMYEQYFGDEVGLFGKDKRQKDPGAVTVGVNYTPFPLMTVGVDRRQGTDHGGETQFNLGLKYEIGTPWAKQVDTSAVGNLRSLAGSRYDLVDRNNQIVLEYRKQEHIRLALAGTISGRAGETKSLGVNATATKGIRNIEWQATSLEAHGGKIIETSPGQYSVLLPTWQVNGANSYTVTGIAYDNDGKASSPASSQVTVTSASISTEFTTFTANPAQLPPDGKSTSTLTLTVKDADGNPIPGQADKLTLNVSGDSDLKTTAATEVSPGVYEITLTAGTTPGTSTITPVVDGVSLKPVVMTIGTPASAENSTFTANPAQLPPDGTSTSTLTLTVKDADGKPVTGQVDKLKLNVEGDSDIKTTKATEVAPGVYEITLTAGTTPGTSTITPVVDGVKLKPVVMTIGSSASAENSTFTANPAQLPPDGTSTSTLTLTVKDADGKPVTGQVDKLKLNVEGDGDIKTTTATEVAPGVYEITLTAGTTPGTSTITPVVDGVSLKPVVMVIEGKASAANSTFIAEPDVLPADGQGTSILTLTVKDADGKPVPGQADKLKLNVSGDGDVQLSAVTEIAPGVYQVTLSAGSTEGTAIITPVVEGVTLNPVVMTLASANAPTVSELHLTGQLAVGETLGATYHFVAGPAARQGVAAQVGAALVDQSTYAWGKKGETASAVTSSTNTVSVSGQVPGRDITLADVGTVLEVSVLAKNSVGVIGNVRTLATDASQADGNDTEGGSNGHGDHGGQIIDPTAQPQLSDLTLKGQLAVGQALSATYAFDANNGDGKDASTYVWGDKGNTAGQVASGQTVATSGTVPSYTLVAADIGHVKELSVQAKNSKSVQGNTLTVATDANPTDGNDTNGGHNGEIIDPVGSPQVANLRLHGELALHQSLSAEYTFDRNGGDAQDQSTYAWGNKGSTSSQVANGQTVATSGTVPSYELVAADIGQVKEVSVQAKNGAAIQGNTLTLATDASSAEGNDTEGGGNGGTIIDPTATPSVSQLAISGELALFSQLSGTYTFAANGGQSDDHSLYLWGEKGTTASAVESENQTVPASGMVGHYAILSSDAGKVLEVSVLPRNGATTPVSGTTVTLATDATAAQGNHTSGGDGHGSIIDPTAIPSLSDLKLHGSLAEGSTLTGSYTFEANHGNTTDTSVYLWGNKGQTASAVTGSQTAVTNSGQVPGYVLVQADVGQVKELSVLPRNGLATPVTGSVKTLATDASAAEGNDTTGGNGHGVIIDPAATPSVSNLKLQGILTKGQLLSATYTFAANGGHDTDQSKYVWGEKGQTESAVTTSTTKVTTTGHVPSHEITQADVGKVLAVSVQANNGSDITGNIQTLATDASQAEGNETTGGDNGEIAAPAFKHIEVNGHNFPPNSGFPKTGFVNATYTLVLDNANASDYNWTSSADSWVNVDSTGKVTFTAEPSSKETVTITATPKSGNGESFSHRFTLDTWFVRNETIRSWSASNTYCQSLNNGYALPTRAQLTNATTVYPTANNASRAVNPLWSEWGDIRSYGFTSRNSWTSEAASGSTHYSVALTFGVVTSNSDTGSDGVVVTCQRGL